MKPARNKDGFYYFSPETDKALFCCTYNGYPGIDYEFVHALDELRHKCGFPFVITSGYRSENHPDEAKKETPGQHTKGIAADIKVRNGAERRTVVEQALKMGFRGIGVAKTFVHVDMRDGPAVMWTY